MGVGDHGALQVEPPVPEVDQVVTVLHVRRGAAQDLPGAQRLRLIGIYYMSFSQILRLDELT